MSEKEIKDYTFYTSEMEKGMKDKLFFLKFLKPDKSYNFLDYGCANGKVLEAISFARRDKYGNCFDTFCGYDKSSDMIDLAKSQWQGSNNDVKFVNAWHKRYTDPKKPTVLILSSVLHEIYSYYSQCHCMKSWIKAFWKEIFDANADYITIRDMCWSKDMDREIEDQYDNIHDYEINYHFLSNFLKNSGVTKTQVSDFEKTWGPITNVKNFMHLLLKYRYIVNWEHELTENYFSLEDTELFSRIIGSNYSIMYVERFQLPVIEKFTKLGYNTNIYDNTHVKVFLKKK